MDKIDTVEQINKHQDVGAQLREQQLRGDKA